VTIAAAPLAILSASNVAAVKSSTVTITTAGAVNFTVGQFVSINGVTPVGYNGLYQVLTVPSANSFTYSTSAIGLGVGTGFGTVTADPTFDGQSTVTLFRKGNSIVNK